MQLASGNSSHGFGFRCAAVNHEGSANTGQGRRICGVRGARWTNTGRRRRDARPRRTLSQTVVSSGYRLMTEATPTSHDPHTAEEVQLSSSPGREAGGQMGQQKAGRLGSNEVTDGTNRSRRSTDKGLVNRLKTQQTAATMESDRKRSNEPASEAPLLMGLCRQLKELAD